ncbi:MAG: TM1812 family CRISPR-associated protein [Armatimonadota bacterium]|nr:TM1812 family CRISPR-associated protein [Armatimonadota bacterium]
MLLTILGQEARDAVYALGSSHHRAPLAPLAIVHLRGGFSRVIAFCTPEAEERTLPVLQKGLPQGVVVEPRPISLPTTDAGIAPFLEKVGEAIQDAGGPVILDVTHGPRHLPLLAFTTVLYLSALGRGRVEGVYYAYLQPGGPSPIIDLTPLLELATLAFAAGELRRTGSTAALVERLENDPSQEAKHVRSQLRALAAACASGLPLEAGLEAARFRRDYRRRLEHWLRSQEIPLAGALVQAIDEELARVALREHRPADGEKGAIPLTKDELERQAQLVDILFQREAYGPAAIAAQEWAVSWAVLQGGEADRWLERETRERALRRLNALAAHAEDAGLRNRLSEDQTRVACFWIELRELRNSFAHAGMRKEIVDPWRSKGKLAELLRRVSEGWYWAKQMSEVSLQIPGAVARILVTPVGRIPGAFYTALAQVESVDRCFCVCSPETEGNVDEVLTRASQRPKVVRVSLADPYRDLDGARRLARKARGELALADEVVVNLTGGTTLMGLGVEWMAEEARRLGRRVRRLVVLDRRSRAEQERDPYVVGEAVWLEEGGPSGCSWSGTT